MEFDDIVSYGVSVVGALLALFAAVTISTRVVDFTAVKGAFHLLLRERRHDRVQKVCLAANDHGYLAAVADAISAGVAAQPATVTMIDDAVHHTFTTRAAEVLQAHTQRVHLGIAGVVLACGSAVRAWAQGDPPGGLLACAALGLAAGAYVLVRRHAMRDAIAATREELLPMLVGSISETADEQRGSVEPFR